MTQDSPNCPTDTAAVPAEAHTAKLSTRASRARLSFMVEKEKCRKGGVDAKVQHSSGFSEGAEEKNHGSRPTTRQELQTTSQKRKTQNTGGREERQAKALVRVFFFFWEGKMGGWKSGRKCGRGGQEGRSIHNSAAWMVFTINKIFDCGLT